MIVSLCVVAGALFMQDLLSAIAIPGRDRRNRDTGGSRFRDNGRVRRIGKRRSVVVDVGYADCHGGRRR